MFDWDTTGDSLTTATPARHAHFGMQACLSMIGRLEVPNSIVLIDTLSSDDIILTSDVGGKAAIEAFAARGKLVMIR